MIAVLLAGAAVLLWRSIRWPSLVAALWVAMLTFQGARTPFESLMPDSVDFATLLTLVGLGFGFVRAAPSVARPHGGRPGASARRRV